jgi:uncharacterized RDD family membrane protein YckC
MACFVYEAMILFGVALIPGVVGAAVGSKFGAAGSWAQDLALRGFAALVFGAYFVGFWSRRGQTLPMQTWHIRLETTAGDLPPPSKALLRYVAAWVWVAPPVWLASALDWRAWPSLGAVGVWIVVYALLSRLHPQRQFWHDALCGTRLVPSVHESKSSRGVPA